MSTAGSSRTPRTHRPPPPPPQSPEPSSSQDPPEIDLTIEAELRKIRDCRDKYPAADLLHALLRFNTINVNLAPRDVHTSFQVVFRSNKVYEAILDAMDELAGYSFEELEEHWDLFDNYTDAIPILERILLDLSATISKARPDAPPDTSTHDAIMHISTWLADRKALKDALEALKDKKLQDVFKDSESSASVLFSDYVVHRMKDDNSTLKVLLGFITKDKLTDEDISPKNRLTLLSDVKKLLGEIQTELQRKSPSDTELSGVVVRAFMTTFIPFAVIASPNTDAKWKDYLKDAKIWESLKSLLTKVKESFDSLGTFAELETIFADIEALLLNLTETTIETAKLMLQLMKLCAQMHRPYSGRTVVLAKALYHVDRFSQDKTVLVARRVDIKQALERAIDHIIKLKATPYTLQDFSLLSAQYKTRKEEHKKLFDANESLYITFGVPLAEWTAQAEAYANAVGIDEQNVTEAQGQFFPMR